MPWSARGDRPGSPSRPPKIPEQLRSQRHLQSLTTTTPSHLRKLTADTPILAQPNRNSLFQTCYASIASSKRRDALRFVDTIQSRIPGAPFPECPLISQVPERALAWGGLRIIRFRANPPIILSKAKSGMAANIFQRLNRTTYTPLVEPLRRQFVDDFTNSLPWTGTGRVRCKTVGRTGPPPIRQDPGMRRRRGHSQTSHWLPVIGGPARWVFRRQRLRRTSRGEIHLQEMRSALRLTATHAKYFQLRPHIRARKPPALSQTTLYSSTPIARHHFLLPSPLASSPWWPIQITRGLPH